MSISMSIVRLYTSAALFTATCTVVHPKEWLNERVLLLWGNTSFPLYILSYPRLI